MIFGIDEKSWDIAGNGSNLKVGLTPRSVWRELMWADWSEVKREQTSFSQDKGDYVCAVQH